MVLCRAVSIPLVLAMLQACASLGPEVIRAPAPQTAEPQFNVTTDEWAAALPARESRIPEPKLLRRAKEDTSALPHNKRASAKLAIVIRADGTVGVYRIVDTDNRKWAVALVEAVKLWLYEPPLKDGKPVAIRGDFEVAVNVPTGIRIAP